VRSRFRSFAGNPRGRRSHGYCRIWQGEATAPSRAQPVALSPAILPRTLLPPSPPRCAPHGRKCQYPLSRCARDAPSRLDAPSVCRSPRSCPLLAAFHTPADLSSLCSRVLSLCSAFAVILSRFSQRVFSPPPPLSLSSPLFAPPPSSLFLASLFFLLSLASPRSSLADTGMKPTSLVPPDYRKIIAEVLLE